MIDTFLADLILEHGDAIYPYVKLRALHLKQRGGDYVEVGKYQEISTSQLHALKVSGYVEYESQEKIRLKKDGKFLGYPEETVVYIRESEQYVPKELEKLTDIMGYPGDWEKNIPKYRKLYMSLASKVPSPIIESVAIWVAKEHSDYQLNLFLSEKCFRSLRSKMESPKSVKTLSRTEASSYGEYTSFEEYDRKLLNGN